MIQPLMRALLVTPILTLLILSLPAGRLRSADLYREPYRPQFHFTPATNWMNDPNGMVWYEGEYHLFYQYNPFGDRWGHMSWGHSVSRDLLHWEALPLALPEEGGVMIFSGSAVVDWKNTTGFGKEGHPPLVAIYTGHYTERPLQNQQIAYSTDRGRTWTKYAGNPVLDIGEKDFRDPKVFWHEPTHRWVMVVSWPVHRQVRFYASPNLKEWTHLSDFGPAGSTTGIWECPDLFPLRVDGAGGGSRWVLTVNVGSGAPGGGSGCQYFVGDFDGTGFHLDPTYPTAPGAPGLWADRGRDFYAAVSWSDVPSRDGRRLWLGWMSNWEYANDVPTAPWRSAMSIPRELGLRRLPEGLRLTQRPVRELATLRGPRLRFGGGSLEAANRWLDRVGLHEGGFEMRVALPAASHGIQGLRCYAGEGEEVLIAIDRDQGRLSVDRSKSGHRSFNPRFSGVTTAPLADPGAAHQLHLLVDACSVEVFLDDGVQVLTTLVLPSPGARRIEAFGAPRLSSIEAWRLASTWR
ncbi:MAG TPA: levanase [Verrucomicrobiales bacterium]|nr:levanase [Verrucomicrobiales bacterium]